MRSLILCSLIVFGFCSADFKELEWKKRVLVLDLSKKKIRPIEQELSRRSDEVLERDVVVYFLSEAVGSFPEDAPAVAFPVLKRWLHESGGLALIGKDGSRKLSFRDGLRLQDIFDRIDSMPMRRREMLNRLER